MRFPKTESFAKAWKDEERDALYHAAINLLSEFEEKILLLEAQWQNQMTK